jgi:hypothetical protein
VKAGNLVLLQGSMWSSYGREGELGLVLETELLTNRSGYADVQFSRILWGDGQVKLYKTNHLELVNENR